MAHGTIELEYEDLKKIIQGKVVFRRCPDCDGTGVFFYTEESDDPVSQKKYEEAGGDSNVENNTECCSTCNGLCYVTNDIRI